MLSSLQQYNNKICNKAIVVVTNDKIFGTTICKKKKEVLVQLIKRLTDFN